MAPVAGYNGDIYLASQTSLAFLDEATTDSGAHTTYTITEDTKRFWDPDVAVSVEVNGGAPAGTYTLQYCGGVIIFDVALAGGDVVTVSGSYLPITQVGEGRKWSLDTGRNLVETGVFGGAWESYTPVRGKGSVSFERFWVDEFFLDHQTELMVLLLYADYANNIRWECFARVESNAIDMPTDGVMGENLKFTVHGEVYYHGV